MSGDSFTLHAGGVVEVPPVSPGKYGGDEHHYFIDLAEVTAIVAAGDGCELHLPSLQIPVHVPVRDSSGLTDAWLAAKATARSRS